jgi:hypothetical protein
MALMAEVAQKWPFDNGDEKYHNLRKRAPTKMTINQLLPDRVVGGFNVEEVVLDQI